MLYSQPSKSCHDCHTHHIVVLSAYIVPSVCDRGPLHNVLPERVPAGSRPFSSTLATSSPRHLAVFNIHRCSPHPCARYISSITASPATFQRSQRVLQAFTSNLLSTSTSKLANMAYQRELGFPLFNDFDPFSAMMPFALGSARNGQQGGALAKVPHRDMPLDVKEVRLAS